MIFDVSIAYICSCLSGRRRVGCCVHVSTLIYFLSWAKYSRIIRFPAEHIINVLIDFDKKEPPNVAKYVKNSRFFTDFQSSESESSGSENSKSDASSEDESSIHIGSSNSFLEIFKKHIPKWGARITIESKQVQVTNTCSIDYFLLAFWLLYKSIDGFINNIPKNENTDILKKIIISIEKKNWNKARELWIVRFIKRTKAPKNLELSMFGAIDECFTKYIISYQRHKRIQMCSSSCSLNLKDDEQSKVNYFDFIYFKKRKEKVFVYNGKEKCPKCKANATYDFIFFNKINFLIIETIGSDIFIKDIPERISFDQKNFVLSCSQIHHNGHFYGIFNINDDQFVVDDLEQSALPLEAEEEMEIFYTFPVVASLYYLNA